MIKPLLKPSRDVDKILRIFITEKPCLGCGRPLYNDPHHLKTRGAGGGDRDNMVPLCRVCHTEAHMKGPKFMDGIVLKRTGKHMKEWAIIYTAEYDEEITGNPF